MVLTREEIFGVKDWRTKEVAVPEWGGSVFVRTMNVAELGEWQTLCLESRGATNGSVKIRSLRERLLAMCLSDSDGKRLFADTDIAQLSERNGVVMDRLFEEAQKFNTVAADDLKDLEGN